MKTQVWNPLDQDQDSAQKEPAEPEEGSAGVLRITKCPTSFLSPLLGFLPTVGYHETAPKVRAPFLPWVQNTGSRPGAAILQQRRGPKCHIAAAGSSCEETSFYLEHQADHTPLGLILLENCQVEPRLGATEPYAFTISDSGEMVGGPTGWQQKPGGAESLAVGVGLEPPGRGWLSQLRPWRPSTGSSCARQLAKSPAHPRGLWLLSHPQDPLLKLPGVGRNEHFGKEIRCWVCPDSSRRPVTTEAADPQQVRQLRNATTVLMSD